MADTKAALDGARYILMERFAEDAALLAKVRDYLWKNAHLVATVVSGKEEEGAKFRDYFDHHEPISTVPSTVRWPCSVVVTKACYSFH